MLADENITSGDVSPDFLKGYAFINEPPADLHELATMKALHLHTKMPSPWKFLLHPVPKNLKANTKVRSTLESFYEGWILDHGSQIAEPYGVISCWIRVTLYSGVRQIDEFSISPFSRDRDKLK